MMNFQLQLLHQIASQNHATFLNNNNNTNGDDAESKRDEDEDDDPRADDGMSL